MQTVHIKLCLCLPVVVCFREAPWHIFYLVNTQVTLSVGLSLLLGRLARYFSLPCDLRNATETRNAYLQGAGSAFRAIILLKLIMSV